MCCVCGSEVSVCIICKCVRDVYVLCVVYMRAMDVRVCSMHGVSMCSV